MLDLLFIKGLWVWFVGMPIMFAVIFLAAMGVGDPWRRKDPLGVLLSCVLWPLLLIKLIIEGVLWLSRR